jgi:glyoxylase-like metal-dependent hydrolase (beta-lactamase superfamily II)
MEYLKVSENVFVMYPLQNSNLLKSASATVPTTCMALPDELIFVDCGSFPDLSSQFRVDMEKKFQRKTTHLLLTHLHWDHFLAMEVFDDVNIVAPELGIPEFNNFTTMIDKTEEDKWGSLFLIDDDKIIKIVKEVKLSPPRILVKKELRIGSTENEVIFRVIGGHSIDSAYIYYPKERVLCAGDNLIECFSQLPGTPEETLKIYSQWESLAIDKVIPGHGNIITKEYLLKVKSYFEDLVSVLKNLIASNIPRREIFNHPSLPRYFARNQPNWAESSRPGMKWIEMTTKSWYRYLKRL